MNSLIIKQFTLTDCAQLTQLQWDFKIEENVQQLCTHSEFLTLCAQWVTEQQNH